MSTQGHEGNILHALALEKAIQIRMREIVEAAASAVRRLKPKGKQQSGLQENQIRNAINVAQESHCTAIVTNFIRYQIGRSAQGQAWQYEGFGLQLIEDIEKGVVALAAKQAAEDAARAIKADDSQKQAMRQEAELRLTRYYLGYLNRAFVFCTRTEHTGHSHYPDAWAVVERIGQKEA